MSDSAVRIASLRRIGAAGDDSASDNDLVAVEEPVQLEIVHGPQDARQSVNAGVVLRTPGRDEDLAAGLLYAEGFIEDAGSIDRMESAPGQLRVFLRPGVPLEDRLARRVLFRSAACGLCGRDAIDDLAGLGAGPAQEHIRMAAALLRALPARLRAGQDIFNETGGLHAAAFFSADGSLMAIAEDIGRHNAVDKLVGWRLRAAPALPPPAVLLVSGRAAFEIVQKAVMARVAVLAAVGAPSSLAVDTARAFNLTLVGFLRDNRFNVYSGFERIV